MRIKRSLGPLLAALLALAVIGPSSAGASERWQSTLCESLIAECPDEFAHPFELEASGEASFSFSSLPTVKCTSATLDVVADEKSGELGEVTGLAFSGCSEGCSVSAKNLPYGAELIAQGGTPKFIEGNGEIPIEDGGSGEPRFELKCGSATCAYADFEQPFYFKAGGEVTASKWGMPRKSGDTLFCPSAMSMTASLDVTAPDPSWATFRGGPSALCEVDAEFCPEENTYPLETALLGQLSEEAKVTFKRPSFNGQCQGSQLELQTTELQGEEIGRGLLGELTAWTFEECTSPSCLSLEALNLPYEFEVYAEKGAYPEWNAAMLLQGKGGPMAFKAGCFPAPCFYEAAPMEVKLSSNGGAMKAVLGPGGLALTSGFPCPVSLELAGEYDITTPQPLYVNQQ